MIDLWAVASHALWISGLALLLMTFSYRSWMGSQPLAVSVRGEMEALTGRLYRLGFLLFVLGMVATSEAWWERLLWAVVLLLGLLQRRPGNVEGRDGEAATAEADEASDFHLLESGALPEPAASEPLGAEVGPGERE